MAKYDFSKNLSGQININNIFDKKYLSSLDDVFYTGDYGDPMNASLKKKVKETFSATSHAPVNFVPEHEIYKMFGNSIKNIKDKTNSRKITFHDTSYMTETDRKSVV